MENSGLLVQKLWRTEILCGKRRKTRWNKWRRHREARFSPLSSAKRRSHLNCFGHQSSKFLLGEFQFHAEWIGEAVGQIRQSSQQVQIYDLLIGEILFQLQEILIYHIVRAASEFFPRTSAQPALCH